MGCVKQAWKMACLKINYIYQCIEKYLSVLTGGQWNRKRIYSADDFFVMGGNYQMSFEEGRK